MQGSTITTKNVACCSTDVNSTIRWDFLRYGGEGGSRTHEPGFARLPAFEAGSFDHSDTSPRWLSHSSGGAAAGQRQTSSDLILRMRSSDQRSLGDRVGAI